MKLKSIAWLAAAFVLGACGNNENKYDATGTFEATETTVYAEQSGRLLRFDVTEGADLVAGNEVGVIDTVPIALRIRQLGAAKEVYASQKPDMRKQVAAMRQQLEKARLEQRRYTELVRDGAAPRKTLDDAVSSVNVLERQLEAQISTLQTTDKSLDRQMHATDTQVSELADQLRKCHISSPVTGCVLEKYVEDGEFVTIGKPLFKVADTKQMFLRAYVTSEQLQNVKIGQHVKVMSDYGKGRTKTYDGTVTWISSQSEFTPKTILTDDERADLVYAVKISVRNDGYLKIGMYGEVKL
ncbi:HlyD family efflux transporter periplasmic adaptor subunit [Hoylesella oralis]|uniref:HlyD family secretion protein n=1 Tax=Hoylesella oralis TaxID=28134 RepID=UPI0028E65A6B|nr:HlyD family efflux transporter periplasmic adaptor subunit [Hoylesella oralis]